MLHSLTRLLSLRTFVHGQLLLEVKAASNLPDMEAWTSKLVNSKDVTDAFVDVKLGSAQLVKTSVIKNDLNPIWNEEYSIQARLRLTPPVVRMFHFYLRRQQAGQ